VDYNRAWVQIRQALESAEITIVESDRDQSFYNVLFAGIIEEEDEPGFISRWFGAGNDDLAEAKGFNVRLMEIDDVINVVTESIESSEDSSQLTQQLLQVIDENLS